MNGIKVVQFALKGDAKRKIDKLRKEMRPSEKIVVIIGGQQTETELVTTFSVAVRKRRPIPEEMLGGKMTRRDWKVLLLMQEWSEEARQRSASSRLVYWWLKKLKTDKELENVPSSVVRKVNRWAGSENNELPYRLVRYPSGGGFVYRVAKMW